MGGKTFFFQFEFLFYAVYMTLCAIVFQCNLVKHVKTVFRKYMLFLSKSGVFYKKVTSTVNVYLGMVLSLVIMI